MPLTITAANVGVGSNAKTQPVVVGQATSHGEVLYVDTTDNNLNKKADADFEETAKARGIAVTAGTANGSTVIVLTDGDLVLGSILTQGVEYYVGTTPGTIMTKAELSAGDYITRLGIAKNTTTLAVDISVTGVTL